MNEIKVCKFCGQNGDEITIEGTISCTIDKYGQVKATYENDIVRTYCSECSSYTDLITKNEWKALNRDEQINEILKD